VRFLKSTALAVALGVLAPSAAFAEQPQSGQDAGDKQNEAEALAKRAFDAYSKGDYTAALSLYQQALQISPAAALYFNIARIYDQKLPDPELAIEFYRKCLTAPDASPDLALKASARIQALNQELAQKRGGSAPPSSGKEETPSTSPSEPPDPGKPLRITGIVVGSIGIAAVGAGAGFGIYAKTKLDTARESCKGATCTTQAGVDAMHSAWSSAKVATVLFIAGGASVGIGVGLYLLAPKKREPTSAMFTGLRLDPVLGPSQAGVNLSGTFF
jgi:tetratricopeptide (TPR) repeat protein